VNENENITQKRMLNLFEYIKSVIELNLKIQTNLADMPFKKFESEFQNNQYISSFLTIQNKKYY
jgi:hypothetical protein